MRKSPTRADLTKEEKRNKKTNTMMPEGEQESRYRKEFGTKKQGNGR